MFAAMVISAALAFSIGGYFMKLSNGLTALGPTALVFVLFALGTGLETLAMHNRQMSTTYIVGLGLEVISAFLLGQWFGHFLQEGGMSCSLSRENFPCSETSEQNTIGKIAIKPYRKLTEHHLSSD